MKTNSERAIIQQFDLKQSFEKGKQDYTIAENFALALRNLETMSRQCMWIFDYSCNNFYYLSSNTDFFPKENRRFVLENGYDYFIRNTHPNDILYLLTIHKAVWDFLRNIPKSQSITDYKICYIIRLLNAKGKYVSVSQQVKLLATDDAGNIWLSMGLFEEINHELAYFPYIENTETDKRFELNEIAQQKQNFKAPKLSEREIELLGYLSKKLLQSKIAELMCISIHTLTTHRRNLYRKLHATNKQEALKNAYYLGLNRYC